MFSTGHKTGFVQSGSKTNFDGYKTGDRLMVTDDQYKGQTFVVAYVSGNYVNLIRDTNKPASLFNTINLPNAKVKKA